jgi:hypothetical protein
VAGPELATFVGGFATAEGTFTVGRRGPTRSFTFAVSLGETDAAACELLQEFFGCGTIHHYARRRAHYDDEVRFQVRKLRDLVERVVPFMDEHLPPSYKREQYGVWRDELLDYWHHRARRPFAEVPERQSAGASPTGAAGTDPSRQSMRGTSLHSRSSS